MLSSATKKVKPFNDAEFVKRSAGRGPKAFLWSYDDDKAWICLVYYLSIFDVFDDQSLIQIRIQVLSWLAGWEFLLFLLLIQSVVSCKQLWVREIADLFLRTLQLASSDKSCDHSDEDCYPHICQLETCWFPCCFSLSTQSEVCSFDCVMPNDDGWQNNKWT